MGKTAIPGAKRATAFMMEPDALTIVGLDTKDGPEHPLYDERIKLPLDEGLVLNVRAYGVMQSVLVRKNGSLIEVVAGRQRVRAAREANKRLEAEGFQPMRIPCMVRKDRDARALGVMVSENENRREDDAVTRALKAQRMMEHGATEEDVAIAFGMSRQAVKNLLRVLDLAEPVQEMIRGQKLTFSAAITLADLTRAEQEVEAKNLAEKGVGVVEAKRLARVRRAERSGKSTANGAKSPRGKAVSVTTLRKVADDEEFMSELEPQARDILRWILGDENAAKRIKGLSARLKSE